ncbi:hypothetical protein IW150_002383, partial [Coemansia sp. RSA 2607]
DDMLTGEISDLSDVEDPHFSNIMPKAGELTTSSALKGDRDSAAENLDTEKRPAATKGNHIVFGSDVEISDNDEDLDDNEASQTKGKTAHHGDHDESDDDDAPEVLGAKKSESEHPTTQGNDDLPQKSSETKNAKKRRRSRKRKATAGGDSESNGAEKSKSVRSKVEEAIAKMSIHPEFEMPKEIPEELRIDLTAHTQQAALKRQKLTENGTSTKVPDGKIDMSVLEQFASETVAQKEHGKREGASSKKSKKAKKAQRSETERVVEGIRVVASNKRDSPTSLLDSLAQAVPRKVMGFAIQKTGGKRVPHADPLVGIARKRGISSIHFLKN